MIHNAINVAHRSLARLREGRPPQVQTCGLPSPCCCRPFCLGVCYSLCATLEIPLASGGGRPLSIVGVTTEAALSSQDARVHVRGLLIGSVIRDWRHHLESWKLI